MSMRVHLLTPCVVPGDGVSNDVLGMRRWLRRRGIPAHAYAGRCHEDLRKRVRPLSAYRQHLDGRDDVLIYCHSVGWRAGIALYEQSRNRKFLRYQNVTPPDFYRPYNAEYVRACTRGLQETRRLVRSRPELLLPGSDFNARGLIACGAMASDCHVVPPLHTIGAWKRVPLDDKLAGELRGRTNLLFVGRVTPNKGQIHLIRALAYYRRYLKGNARLYLVGSFDAGTPAYLEELRAEIRRHGLEDHVHLRGKVGARELNTYYSLASVFMCASEHEGFCVPLVEAMYYGIPIVAYAGSAVGETLATAGLSWPTPEPALLAQSVHEIMERPEVRAALVEQQRERYQTHFTTKAIERRLDQVLGSLLGIAGFSSRECRRVGDNSPTDSKMTARTSCTVS
jgi:glycosyltransferase involved in cell wall biosynthesis